VAPEGAIRTLQDMMPPGAARPMPPVELEAVAPALLLPPVQARSTVAAALAGGIFELGDRVTSLRAGGDGPPFGLRGTVSVLTHDLVGLQTSLLCNVDCERCGW
jgi:hypothetical protein